ncbi:MAG: hypothetical protein NVS4B2_27040 [Chloroflexota bacterium]
MNCPNCGQYGSGKFCTMCGTKLVGDDPRAASSDFGTVWPGTQPAHQPVTRSFTTDDVASTAIILRADLEEFAARAASHESSPDRLTFPPPAHAEDDGRSMGAPIGIARPAGASDVAVEQTHATDLFRIHYTVGSFAERSLPQIVERIETTSDAVTTLLALPRPSAVIDIYLSEIVVDSLGSPLVKGGYVVPERLQIFEVYRSDAPGETLERSVLMVLLAIATGQERMRFPLLLDGVHARVMQSLGGFPPEEQVVPVLIEAKSRGDLPSISALLAGRTIETQAIYFPAAAGFIGFLIRTFGAQLFLAFLREVNVRMPEDAAPKVFGRKLGQLDKAWHKTLKPVKPRGVLHFIRLSGGYLRPYRLKVFEIVVYLSLSVAFGIGMAKLQGTLLDKALIPGDRHALFVIMAVLIGSFVVVSLTSLRQSYLGAYVSESIVREIRLRIFTLLQRLHPGFFHTIDSGDIMSRMTSDVAAIEFALTGAMLQGLRLILMLVAAMVTIFFTNWKLAAIAMAGTPLFFITGRYLGPAASRASKERQQNLAKTTSRLQEDLAAQPVIKAFGLQERVIHDFTNDLDTVFRSSLRLTYLAGIFGISSNSIASAIQLVVLGVGAWLVIGHELSTGTLFAFLALMMQIIGPIQSISGIIQALQQASGSMDRVDELLKAEPAIVDAADAQRVPPLSQSIRLENVSFGYTPREPILHDLNLEIPAGARVALVGPSGCGKSSVLNLIMRFYDPQHGRLVFDSVDLRQASLESVRDQMGIVFQDNLLFNLSIRDNIRLGCLSASEAEVEAAAKAAELDEFITGMPDGYDTIVGERGNRLSGGQRQRVAIARAIVRNPTILLLDEATSALDPRTEAAITETLDRLGRGRTTIAVTHRLSSVVHADLIYVMEHGRLVEQGTHGDLLRRGGLYSHLWREQGGGIASVDVAPAQGIAQGVESDRLRGVPLFARLDSALLAEISQRIAVEHIAAGETVITKGESGDKLYVIDRGEVEVFASNAAAHQDPLAVLHAGDYFGEIALLYDVPRTAAVRARTPLQLYTLSKGDLRALLARVPVLAQEMADRGEMRMKQTRLRP